MAKKKMSNVGFVLFRLLHYKVFDQGLGSILRF